jgi:hypothetical protein
MRGLEHLGEESPRAMFFASTRRLMLDLLRGRTDTAAHLIGLAAQASKQASLADAWRVIEALTGYAAGQSGDTAKCARVAAECEQFALTEGATAVCAEAAYLWLRAEQPERSRRLVHTFHGPVLDGLPRDVNWLLTLQCVLEAALGVDDREIIENASRLLTPYTGRAVFNAGAVMFHGMTDDTLARAAAVLGDPGTARRLRDHALSTYERLGATWWRDRLHDWTAPAGHEPSTTNRRLRLHPSANGLWLIGPDGAAVTVRALRGYSYLRELVRRPGLPISALDLVANGTGTVAQPGVGQTLDRQAIHAYRGRLRDIDDDVAEAEQWSDTGRIEALHAERDALVDQLAAAVGLGGRTRDSGGSTHERARIAATKAIGAAITHIAEIDEPLGRHLQTTIRTGKYCCYQPPASEQPAWITSADTLGV